MNDLTKQDCELLIEAVGNWEAEPVNAGLLSGMIAAIVRPKGDNEKKGLNDPDKIMAEAGEKSKGRRMAGIRIKAKLVAIHDSLMASDPVSA